MSQINAVTKLQMSGMPCPSQGPPTYDPAHPMAPPTYDPTHPAAPPIMVPPTMALPIPRFLPPLLLSSFSFVHQEKGIVGGMCLWAMACVLSPHWDLSPLRTHLLCTHQPSGQTLPPPIFRQGGSSPGFSRGSPGPAVGTCVAPEPWPGGEGTPTGGCVVLAMCFFPLLRTVVRHGPQQPRATPRRSPETCLWGRPRRSVSSPHLPRALLRGPHLWRPGPGPARGGHTGEARNLSTENLGRRDFLSTRLILI